MKFVLPYLDNKEGRVCQVCCNALLRGILLLSVLHRACAMFIVISKRIWTHDLWFLFVFVLDMVFFFCCLYD